VKELAGRLDVAISGQPDQAEELSRSLLQRTGHRKSPADSSIVCSHALQVKNFSSDRAHTQFIYGRLCRRAEY
jgi:hypothetical protein